MSQQRSLTLTALLLLCTCLLYLGCSDDSKEGSGDSGKQTDKSGKDGAKSQAGKPKPLLKGWEKPALALVVSGEVHGYLEPCGCSETQSGGLARRADLFRQLREERGWDVGALDLGGLLNPDRSQRKQSQLKFEAMKQAMNMLGYASVGLGVEEIILDQGQPFFLYSQFSTVEEDGSGKKQLQLLSANVQPYQADQLEFPQSHQTFAVGGKKVAVTSIMGEALFQEKFGNNKSIGYKPPAEVLPGVIKKMQAENPDMLVLLSHASLEESRKLAEQFPQFPLIVSAGTENPHHEDELYVGKTRLFTLGHKGKHVAVVGFYPNQEKPVQVEVVDLDKDRFASDPRMRKVMASYQQGLRLLYQEANSPLLRAISHPDGGAAKFVGAEKCGSCHKKAYAKWKTTRHAHAFESLEIGRKGQEDTWVSRIHDPECLACHVTGWDPQQALPYHNGFTSAEETPHLKGQQCENCHGPGGEHTRLEELWVKDRSAVKMEELIEGRRSVTQSKGTVEKKVCNKCHDHENSPNFNFEKYWPKVEHRGRD